MIAPVVRKNSTHTNNLESPMSYPSTPSLVDEAFQNAFDEGYRKGLEDARAQLDRLLASIGDTSPVITIVGRQKNWPSLANNIVSFNGKEVQITNREAIGLKLLLDARGNIVSFKEMCEAYGSRDAKNTGIHFLRKSLRLIPEIEVENFGNGQRLVIREE